MRRALTSAFIGGAAASAGGAVKLDWSDCGDSSTHGHITSLSPTSVTLGSRTTLSGKGEVDETVTGATYKMVAKAGWITLFQHSGDACRPDTINIPFGVGKVNMKGFKCPLSPGAAELDMDLTMSASLPASMAYTTMTVTAQAAGGDKMLCVQVKTSPQNLVQDGENLVAKSEDYPTPSGKTMVNDQDLIDQYNAANDAGWVAGANDFFKGMTFDDARPILGTALEHISQHLNNTLPQTLYDAMGDVPAEFDARTQWKGLIHPIRNQQHCGSCWAFSAAEVLSDRVAIATNKPSPSLSPEDLVSCDSSDMGCKGGRLSNAWSYLKNTGIVTDKCFPYTAGGGNAPACATKCADSESFTRQKASSAYPISGVANMQKEIMTHGPIQVAFLVYKSFMSYKSGVYTKHFWELLPEGGHAVKMVGWGTESGTDYWLVANSWGTTQWGDLGGFFKIKRGTNECGIEAQGPPYAGLPATSSNVVV